MLVHNVSATGLLIESAVALAIGEAIAMADRVLVMREGRITAEISRDDATSENVMFAATHSSELHS